MSIGGASKSQEHGKGCYLLNIYQYKGNVKLWNQMQIKYNKFSTTS